jgi:hypothetical protein
LGVVGGSFLHQNLMTGKFIKFLDK